MTGLLMTAENVRAILSGRKTQTRRLIKLPKVHADFGEPHWDKARFESCDIDPDIQPQVETNSPRRLIHYRLLHVPYGDENCACGPTVQRIYPRYSVGQKLFIKETWKEHRCADLEIRTHFRADGGYCPYDGETFKWKSPLFLSEKLARIFVEITEVRAQRLQDTSVEDAIAEGLTESSKEGRTKYGIHGTDWEEWRFSPIDAYATLWNRINKPPHDWGSNPWVWAYTFKRVEQ